MVTDSNHGCSLFSFSSIHSDVKTFESSFAHCFQMLTYICLLCLSYGGWCLEFSWIFLIEDSPKSLNVLKIQEIQILQSHSLWKRRSLWKLDTHTSAKIRSNLLYGKNNTSIKFLIDFFFLFSLFFSSSSSKGCWLSYWWSRGENEVWFYDGRWGWGAVAW